MKLLAAPLVLTLLAGLDPVSEELVFAPEKGTELTRTFEARADYDPAETALIEALRALRMLHYAAWLARRWHDPAFPRAFPWFGEARYWERHVAELEEQLAAFD